MPSFFHLCLHRWQKTLIRDLDEGHDNHQRHFNFEAIEALVSAINVSRFVSARPTNSYGVKTTPPPIGILLGL